MELRDWVEETAAGLEERVGAAEDADRRLRRLPLAGPLRRLRTRCPGQQSSSVALLDSRRSGVVISSILHRDQARVYVKQVREGESELELSPEEQEAIDTALARRPPRGA